MSKRVILNLPKHRNPGPNRTASAPYNFVPLPEVVVTAVNSANDLPDHDRYEPDKYTGYFDVTLTTKSPLYIRCPFTLEEFLRQERGEDRDAPFRQQVKNTPHFFYMRDPGQPVIPGSSLRGMLRSLLEIVSYGKVQWVTDSLKIYYRAVAAAKDDPLGDPYRRIMGKFGVNVQAGYLIKKGDEWYIKPAKKPSNMRWPEKGAYLKVKEDHIPDGAIPGFVRFSSPKYRPQYHPVSFNVEVRKGKRGKFVVVTDIGPLNAGYSHRGVLVCSGNMLETGGANATSPRKRHALVLEADDNAKLIKINRQAVEDYLDALTPFQTEPPFDEKMGCLVEGHPIFYTETGEEIFFFGHCPNFRVPAFDEERKRTVTPLDFVPEELHRPEDIDYAEALFGFVRRREELDDMKQGGIIQEIPKQGDKRRAYAGRVFVTDAVLVEGQTDIWLSNDPIIPRILASPKPTAFQHYLVQTSEKKNELKHYDSKTPEETVIRGHKRYWLQGEPEISGIQENDPQWLEGGQVREDSTQHTQFKPIKPGVKFKFRICFENLSDRELGALCWVLHPLGDPNKEYCHQLGMGKPLGMGAVKLEAILHLTDRAKRYASLFDGDNWQTGICGPGQSLSDRAPLQRLTRKFEEHVLGLLNPNKPCRHLYEMKRIAMLLKMMEWPGYPPVPNSDLFLKDENRPNTRYMRIQPENEYRNRPVLPDPSAFGCLTGDAEPSATSGEVSPSPEGRKGVPSPTVSAETVHRSIMALRGPGDVSRVPQIVRHIEKMNDLAGRRECAEMLRQWLHKQKLWNKEPHASAEWRKRVEQWLKD